jgi:hypothetical protein
MPRCSGCAQNGRPLPRPLQVEDTVAEPQIFVDPLPHPEVVLEAEKAVEQQQQQQQQAEEAQQKAEALPMVVKLPSTTVTLPLQPKEEEEQEGSGPALFAKPTVRLVALYMLPAGFDCASILTDNFAKASRALLRAYVPEVVPSVQVSNPPPHLCHAPALPPSRSGGLWLAMACLAGRLVGGHRCSGRLPERMPAAARQGKAGAARSCPPRPRLPPLLQASCMDLQTSNARRALQQPATTQPQIKVKMLFTKPDKAGDLNFSELEVALVGGAPLPAAELGQLPPALPLLRLQHCKPAELVIIAECRPKPAAWAWTGSCCRRRHPALCPALPLPLPLPSAPLQLLQLPPHPAPFGSGSFACLRLTPPAGRHRRPRAAPQARHHRRAAEGLGAGACLRPGAAGGTDVCQGVQREPGAALRLGGGRAGGG